MSKKEYISTDNLDLLLNVLPPHVRAALIEENHTDMLIEIVLDLGRLPEARYPNRALYISQTPVTHDDINYVASRVGNFTRDNRAGIERTLHRISAIRNRLGEIVGLTCRVGRAIFGTVDIIRDVVESGKSILLMGKPGVGKTTLLREAARVLADDSEKRVIIVDTSNEIAGDGDIPHPGIGRARRMQVPDPDHQHSVMIEAVENHMPEVIVIDEIGTSQEALAARTIAERGVQLIATVHGNTLENLMINPTLSDLVGGIQPVTLSDEEARRRRTQKTVLERKAPPTFDVLIEIQHKDSLTIHQDVARAVDQMLRGYLPQIEIRERHEDGEFTVTQPERPTNKNGDLTPTNEVRSLSFQRTESNGDGKRKSLRIFPYALSRERLSRAIEELGVSASIARDIDEADIMLTLKSHAKRQSQKLREARGRNIEVHVVRSNTVTQMENFLRGIFRISGHAEENEDVAMQEVEDAVLEAIENRKVVELSPQPNHIRRKQHLYVERSGLTSKSKGQEPLRHIVVYPL